MAKERAMIGGRTLSMRFFGGVALTLLLIGAGVAWFTFDPGFRAGRETPSTASDVPTDEFGRRVRDYLLANPEVIDEVIQRLQTQRRAAELSEAQTVLKARADEVFRDPASPVGGNPEGDVTLVEFFDYNCPYCRQMEPILLEAESADPALRIAYKEFPILGPNSVFAAKAALAAHLQGQYVAFHRSLMQTRGRVGEDAVLKAAADIGLDVERLRTDMEDPAIRTAIDRNLALARALRISGTPGYVVGDQIQIGATDLATLQGLMRRARTGK
jgi:protein-disulfide isomerase